MGFHIDPDFLASSDQHTICILRVALRAAGGFFILVLVFMYLQMNENKRNSLGATTMKFNRSKAKWRWLACIRFLSRIARRQGSLLPMKVILANFKVLVVKTGNTTQSQSEGAKCLLKFWL